MVSESSGAIVQPVPGKLPKDTYSTVEAARELGVSRETLLRWFRQGKVADVKRDRKGWRVFRQDDIERIRREAC
jgi:excisionase family DNA binding protein